LDGVKDDGPELGRDNGWELNSGDTALLDWHGWTALTTMAQSLAVTTARSWAL